MRSQIAESITTIADRLPFAQKIIPRLVRSYEILNREAMHPRPDVPQVSFYNHGNTFSWLVVPLIWGMSMIEDGYGDYRSGIIFHPVVYKVPGISAIGDYFAGGFRATSADDVTHGLAEGIIDHFGTMPEGANCALQYDEPIAPFRYNGLIWIGLKTGADFLLVVHKGTEQWNRTIRLPRLFRRLKGVHLPIPFPPLESVRVHFSRYQPKVQLEELRPLSANERIRRVDEEGERMRREMLRIYREL